MASLLGRGGRVVIGMVIGVIGVVIGVIGFIGVIGVVIGMREQQRWVLRASVGTS